MVRGRSAQLVRENVIQLIGKRNMGSQMILRGVFAHALSRKTPWELMPQKIINQPKLQDAAITQFVIEDGWIGLSLGPKQTTTARRHAVWIAMRAADVAERRRLAANAVACGPCPLPMAGMLATATVA